MKFDINSERLATTFTELCEIDSPSKHEAGVLAYLKDYFTRLGADEIIEDSSREKTGSECNNLIVRFHGTLSDVDPIFFSAHMDTVLPADNVQVKREGDMFFSKGDTVLGGDDKSGIAPIIEMISFVKENNIPHCSVEFLFTTCEEIGLRGAKHIDRSLITAKYGYALDSTGINKIIYAAPAANKIRISVHGKAAHAGINPERGINALQIAAKAISQLPQGRLDENSTCNFGVIKGGMASNIVPDLIIIEGEVRSHNEEKLEEYTKNIADTFTRIVKEYETTEEAGNATPAVELEIIVDYPAMSIDKNEAVIQRAEQAGKKIDVDLEYVIGGGGSDANIFNGFGFPTVILATGMNKVHTTDECIDLNDMISVTQLLIAMISE